MLTRACAVAQKSYSKAPSQTSGKKATLPASRSAPRRYCSTTSPETTIADSAKANGASTLSKRLGVNPAFSQLTGGFANMGGVAQAAPAAAAPAAAAAPTEAAKPAADAKPSRVDVKLVKFADANKFKVLKEIRNLKPGMNLMESKALIEGLPKVVMENLIYKDAEDWKKALTEAGAEVELV